MVHFAARILDGDDLDRAADYANMVGALAVTRHGAIPAIPRLADVEQFMVAFKKEA